MTTLLTQREVDTRSASSSSQLFFTPRFFCAFEILVSISLIFSEDVTNFYLLSEPLLLLVRRQNVPRVVEHMNYL